MCQIPVMASPSSPPPPPPPPPSPKLLNPQPQTQPLPPQPSLKLLNPQSLASTPSPKLLNPHAQPFTPPSPSESQRRTILLPHELIEQQQQQCQYTLAPVMTRHFVLQPMYYYQPRPVWSPHQAKVEYYNAFLQPLQGNVVTYYGEKEVAVVEHVEEYGKKMDQRVKRFIPPRARLQGKSNVVADGNKIWAPKKSDENTTLMIKNIPNQLQRHDLLRILDDHCREENTKGKLHPEPCRSEYDFVYLPMDFGYRSNLGYAFVNFTTAAAATRFSKAFHKFAWDAQVPGSKKICQVTRAVIQGKNALIYHFERSKFRCHTDDYLPVTLSPPRDGWKNTSPTIVGKRIDTGPAVAIQRRKCILMMRNKRLLR